MNSVQAGLRRCSITAPQSAVNRHSSAQCCAHLEQLTAAARCWLGRQAHLEPGSTQSLCPVQARPRGHLSR